MFERTRQKEHGDFATNVAMTLAKPARANPRELAEKIVAALPDDDLITKVDIAGPGFINVFVAQTARYAVLDTIFKQTDQYGLGDVNSKAKVLVEFVSANPTGPLHVGHGRGAAYGDALVRVLRAAGNCVESEYYVNDAGRQMDILAISVWLRYLQEIELTLDFPDNCYKGAYIVDRAKEVVAEHGDKFLLSVQEINQASENLEDEAALDAIALNSIIADIRDDLAEFGVDYNTWYSERSLFDSGKIDKAIEKLKISGHLYEKGGAWWFKSSEFGDEKDRVVVRDNGQPTYFASDIAYHQDKLDRGFDECINIWGSDHHGYIPRVKAALQALDLEQDKLTVLLVQFAVLYRSGEKISMSTRSGEFVTLRELRDEVGSDAARFFYVQRKSEQHMDFDLDLAKSQSNENPVYYVQYAHARICSVFAQAEERKINFGELSESDFSLLENENENALLALLQRFPEVIQNAARDYEPHQLTYFLRDVATAFHSYYNSVKFLDAEDARRRSMLALCAAVKQVLVNGLNVVGVSAPEKM
ncbi:UNVERIFIED_CONTAM: hypothetical protein GTU68_001348 [Idotea baltica]|nr:hypothetical protein [Idotea baltica]